MRPAPTYSLVASAGSRGTGQVYAFDTANGRLIALDKVNGTYRAQYWLTGGFQGWDLRAMAVVPGADTDPPTLIWMSHDALYQTVLTNVGDGSPGASASPGPSASAAPASANPKPTRKPTRKP